MSDEVLQLEGISKRFGSLVAVDRLSERFARGEYFCILGPSGCGKTTLLRMVAGFEAPDEGRLLLHGRDVAEVPPERRDVNVVFQSYALFPHLSVRGNIAFGLRMKRVAAAESRRRVEEMLALVHLEREAARLPRQLSGGQQQRVALARALVNRPAVLLLDEPLSALDQSLRQRMQAELRRIQRETGVTFLHITHDQAEALSLADRIAVMRAGRFLQVAPPRELYRRPATRFVASFVGATNLLAARVRDASTVLLGDAAVRLPVPAGLAGGDAVLLAVRPECVRIAAADGPGAVAGVVRSVAFAGATLEYEVALPHGAMVRAALPADRAHAPAPGEAVAVDFEPEALTLLRPDEDQG